jgi:RHS repeat-associated protein
MVVDSNDSIRETISYYPFGSEMQMTNPALLTGGTSHPYRFTGKELVRLNGLNQYDFGARWYDVAGVPMWTSVDPLAEKYYNVSPYAYCHNNPINRIDIDGLYDFEGISNWSNPVIAVFPVAEQRDKIIQLDYQSAHDASVPIITVTDIADFGAALSDLKQKGIPFESIAINSHGNFNGFKIGSEEVDLTSDLSVLKEGLEDKTLFVGACNVGMNNILVDQIAEGTQSTVIAPQHKLPAGYQYDGSDFLNIRGKRYIPTYSPAQYYVSNGNTSKTVTNITIDKNNGIKWDGFMPTFKF